MYAMNALRRTTMKTEWTWCKTCKEFKAKDDLIIKETDEYGALFLKQPYLIKCKACKTEDIFIFRNPYNFYSNHRFEETFVCGICLKLTRTHNAFSVQLLDYICHDCYSDIKKPTEKHLERFKHIDDNYAIHCHQCNSSFRNISSRLTFRKVKKDRLRYDFRCPFCHNKGLIAINNTDMLVAAIRPSTGTFSIAPLCYMCRETFTPMSSSTHNYYKHKDKENRHFCSEDCINEYTRTHKQKDP